MKKFIIILFFVLSVILITLFFSGKTVDSDPLNCKDCNLIIISLTNTRKDNLGIYNNKEITSPNIAPRQCPTCKGPVGFAETNSTK